MRLTLTMDEYFKLTEILVKHKEIEMAELIREKFKDSLPSQEAFENKQNAGKKARAKVANRNNKKVDIAIEELIREKELITVTSVAKKANISYNTANKYKVRIQLAASNEKNKKENPHQFQ
ncbi:MAG: hypothetical protein ACERKK_04090 [Poseidonibacter sp.]|uniref:hypothetical protein n=1 Tax=Poseidonibacter sp. TaxID=2321188 RepID=UPI00359DBF1A